MNLRYILGLTIFSLLVPSCNIDDIADNSFSETSDNIIKLSSVCAEGFYDNYSSRSTYDGYATSFETGDRLGLLLIGKEGETIKQLGNIPFTYTDVNTWNNDNNQNYFSAIESIIAYFPYNEGLSSDITTLDGLKNSIEIDSDQSDLENFKSMDLLVCEISNPSPELDLQLSHAFSLVDLSAISDVTVDGETFRFNVELSEPAFSIGETMYNPCTINGSYVCLVNDNQTFKRDYFRYFYSIGGKTYVKTIDSDISLQSGIRYTFPCLFGAGEDKTELSAGDFYCISQSGKNVILPEAASSIPEGLTCKGIVFYVMDANEWGTFTSNNDLTADNLSGYDGNHGLVISIANGNPFGTMTVDYLKSSVFNNILEIAGNLTTFTGYKLTQTLKNFTESAEFKFSALDNFKESIQNTTSWYVPSFYELSLIYDDIDYLNSQISNKIEGGVTIDAKMPTVSFDSDDNALDGFIVIENGNNVWAGIPGENIRPIFAF